MEIIQYFQYKVIDQCNNKWNKFLTQLGYLHICFQPLFFNIWLFAFTKKPNFFILKLCFYAGLLLASRLFFVKEKERPNYLSRSKNLSGSLDELPKPKFTSSVKGKPY